MIARLVILCCLAAYALSPASGRGGGHSGGGGHVGGGHAGGSRGGSFSSSHYGHEHPGARFASAVRIAPLVSPLRSYVTAPIARKLGPVEDDITRIGHPLNYLVNPVHPYNLICP
jgi:hypothetical protein